MAASIIHGKRISKSPVSLPDGSDGAELISDGGGWADASYSTVARTIEHCESIGLTEDDWPIFYGRYPGDVDLDEVARRCDRLRPLILGLSEDEGPAALWLFATIRTWLGEGEVFAVFE